MPTIERRASGGRPDQQGGRAAARRAHRAHLRPQDLVDITTQTVLHNMVVGVALIFLIQWLFLGDLRSALIVSATIPFAFFFAVVILVLRGESANLLSMGAIDFGLIVDATVIMVENIFRHLGSRPRRGRSRRGRPPRGSTASWRRSSMPRPRSRRRSSSRPPSSSPASCRCSRCRASRATSSARWPAPTPTPCPAACSRPSRSRPHSAALLLPEKVRAGRDPGGARPAPRATAGCCDIVACPSRRRLAAGVGAGALAVLAVQLARPGVPAQARGRQHVDPRRHAGHDLARGGQRLRQSHARR